AVGRLVMVGAFRRQDRGPSAIERPPHACLAVGPGDFRMARGADGGIYVSREGSLCGAPSATGQRCTSRQNRREDEPFTTHRLYRDSSRGLRGSGCIVRVACKPEGMQKLVACYQWPAGEVKTNAVCVRPIAGV